MKQKLLLYYNQLSRCIVSSCFIYLLMIPVISCSNRNLKSLQWEVNVELKKLCEWLTANKLTLNAKKSNYVTFRNYRKKLSFQPTINIFGNDKMSCTFTIRMVKIMWNILAYLLTRILNGKLIGLLMALQISKTIGMIAKLRHFVHLSIIFKLYQSLTFPYLTCVWN